MAEIDEKYTIYRHITPENKSYIGVTKLKVNDRFQNGNGYKNCSRFKKAIDKYGWENIKHEILYISNDKEEALLKEIEFISLFKSNDENYGYNIERGGSKKNLVGKYNSFYGNHHTFEQKQKWSLERKGKLAWNRNKYGKINKTNKRVKCVETGKIFECVRDVERQLNIIHSSISKCCNKKIKTAGGYHWEFI